jgi:hypothetical protein
MKRTVVGLSERLGGDTGASLALVHMEIVEIVEWVACSQREN